jgi:hypothetical protein
MTLRDRIAGHARGGGFVKNAREEMRVNDARTRKTGSQTPGLYRAASEELRDLFGQAMAAERGTSLTEGLSLPMGEDEMAILADPDLELPATADELARFSKRDITAITARVLRLVRDRDDRRTRVSAAIGRLLAGAGSGLDSEVAAQRLLDEAERRGQQPNSGGPGGGSQEGGGVRRIGRGEVRGRSATRGRGGR